MIRKSVAEILDHQVRFDDRPDVSQRLRPIASDGRRVRVLPEDATRGPVPSTTMVAHMSARFVAAIERFVETEGVDLVTFEKRERKDDVGPGVLEPPIV
jgi:hypothetical protein